MLSFNVVGTSLNRTDNNRIVEYNRGGITAEFSFNEQWEAVEPVVAQFSLNGGAAYAVRLTDNCCLVPWEVLTDEGRLEVSVQGGNLLCTNAVELMVLSSGVVGGLIPTAASPTVYTELCNKYEELSEKLGSVDRVLGGVL